MQELESLPFTIAHLHAAYREGLSPEEIVEEVARRSARVGDPGIFISIAPLAALKAEAAALGAFDPIPAALGRARCGEGQHRRRRPADHRGLSGICLFAGARRGGGGAAARAPAR